MIVAKIHLYVGVRVPLYPAYSLLEAPGAGVLVVLKQRDRLYFFRMRILAFSGTVPGGLGM